MQSAWQQFLIDQGASFAGSLVGGFSDQAAETTAIFHGNVVAPLNHLGVIRLSGDDARQFLHNQLSNDIEHLGPDDWRLAAYCNAKGRTLAVLRIFTGADHALYMILPRDIIEPTIKRLRMFVLMSKVTIEDVSKELPIIAASGPAVAAQIQPWLIDKRLAHVDSLTLLKIDRGTPRYLIIGEPAAVQSMWLKLSATATPVGIPAWQLLEIHQGEPQVFATTVEAFVPQMLNMHAIDGISFKKGCYPGQEIVARMYYLGKLKRRMYLARATQGTCPNPGDPLYTEHSDSSQGAGQVVMASPSLQGIDLLIVAPVSNVEAGPLHLESTDGPELAILPLPYEVPLERVAS